MEIKNVGFVVENPAFLIFRDGRKEYDTEKKAQALSGMGANKELGLLLKRKMKII